jgi:nicotinate-nucleotide pyrophosphorylase (carboxylating)
VLDLPPDLATQVEAALTEDIGRGDLTAALVPAAQRVRGRVITREAAVLAGRAWVDETYRRLDRAVALTWHVADAERIAADQVLFEIAGPARAVLSGERTALNFLQLLSGTATAARAYVDAVAGTGARILDTRKTLPGLRTAQKYAVRCGGADNHRLGLFDQILIKENHIVAAGSITAAIAAARAAHTGVRIEVEVETAQALAAAPDIILLDDFSLSDMRAAVALRDAQSAAVKLEASGSVTLQSVRAVADTGVDYISVGAITKHVRSVDLSMRLEFRGG